MNTIHGKVHPSVKQPATATAPRGSTTKPSTGTKAGKAATATTTTTAGSFKFPPTKAQQFQPAIRYRPVPPPTHHNDRRRRRQCGTCKCCFLTLLWATLIISAFLVLAAAVFYALYRPFPPSFQLYSLNIAQLNLTSAPHFATKLNLTMISHNPNDRMIFYYNPTNVTVVARAHKEEEIEIGQGSFPGFVQNGQNMTSLFTVVSSKNIIVDDGSLDILRSGMNGKNGRLDLKISIETEMRVKIGSKVKTKKVGLRVDCDGIKIHGSTGKFVVDLDGVNCKVHFFIKLLEFEVPI